MLSVLHCLLPTPEESNHLEVVYLAHVKTMVHMQPLFYKQYSAGS